MNKKYYVIEEYTNEYGEFKTLLEAEKSLTNVEQIIAYASSFEEAYSETYLKG